MKKTQYKQRGPIPQDVIETVEFETPALKAGEVLVEVLAAPINPSDVLTLTGEYGMLPPLPAVGGMEGVGKVIELGEGVGFPKVGQRVLLSAIGGTWTTHLVAQANSLMPLPDGVDVKQQSMMTVMMKQKMKSKGVASLEELPITVVGCARTAFELRC